MKKLNLGCGTDIKQGYLNLDIVALKGIDLIADLSKTPYPFKDNTFDEILIRHVLEHLSDTITTMEEIYRISKPAGYVHIAVPYWNSYGAVLDPTHKSFFHQQTFDYFDPTKELCQSKGFYTKARFKIVNINYVHQFKILKVLQRIIPIKNQQGHYKIPAQIRIKNKLLKWLHEQFAYYFCNVINTMEIVLKTIKEG